MSEPTPPGTSEPDERIGAWLDGELTDQDAAAFAAELDADPDLAAKVEAIRDIRERLAGSRASEVPAGFTARVQQAVTAETSVGPDAEPASLRAARARRDRRRRRVVAAGSVAAAAVAVAVLTPTLGTFAPQTEDAAEVDVAEEAAEQAPGPGGDAPAAREGEADDAGDAEAADGSLLVTSAGDVPLVIDDQRVFTHPSALLDHVADRPEAVELLGAPPAQAEAMSDRTAAELRRADAFADATPPAACVADVRDAAGGPAVFARVERLVLDGEPLTAHLVVSAPPGEPLATITVHLLDPDAGCAARLTERLD